MLREKLFAWDFDGWNRPQRAKLAAGVFGSAGAYIAGFVSAGNDGFVSVLALGVVAVTVFAGLLLAALFD